MTIPTPPYPDAHGIAFDDHRGLFEGTPADEPLRLVKCKKTLVAIAAENDRCWLCGVLTDNWTHKAEIHHIVGGSRGRSDERCNLLYLCRLCHGTMKSLVSYGEQYWLLLVYAREHVDWKRMAVLRRCYLTETPTPPAMWRKVEGS